MSSRKALSKLDNIENQVVSSKTTAKDNGSKSKVPDKTTTPSIPSRLAPRLSPPEAPRTAFMCFMEAKQQRISEENNNSSSTQIKQNSDSYRLVAEEWRKLSHQERTVWDEAARKDKLRFAEEKAAYDGPWDLPKRRAKKHPLAPKRPMSAFLKFSQTRRKIVKSQNPDMSNTDVSRLLGEMWRNARPAERDPYIEDEAKERIRYKAEIAKFKSEQARREALKLEYESDLSTKQSGEQQWETSRNNYNQYHENPFLREHEDHHYHPDSHAIRASYSHRYYNHQYQQPSSYYEAPQHNALPPLPHSDYSSPSLHLHDRPLHREQTDMNMDNRDYRCNRYRSSTYSESSTNNFVSPAVSDDKVYTPHGGGRQKYSDYEQTNEGRNGNFYWK